jgi:hypothetical protein
MATKKSTAQKGKKAAPKAAKQTAKKAVSKKTSKYAHLVRKVQQQRNGSTTVALPAELVRELGWGNKKEVVVKMRGNGLVVEEW